ncbi:hypothetical protein L1887_19569 [Cichorium endivia]|nr:hypothetical protein L1887_19569 [Cichorium endivia]
MINKEKPPDAVFPQIMRDTKQRNGGNDSLGNDNLELKPPDLVLVAVGAEGVNDQEQRRRHTDYKEGVEGECEAKGKRSSVRDPQNRRHPSLLLLCRRRIQNCHPKLPYLQKLEAQATSKLAFEKQALISQDALQIFLTLSSCGTARLTTTPPSPPSKPPSSSICSKTAALPQKG